MCVPVTETHINVQSRCKIKCTAYVVWQKITFGVTYLAETEVPFSQDNLYCLFTYFFLYCFPTAQNTKDNNIKTSTATSNL